MISIAQDVYQIIRTFRRRPWSSAAIVLMLTMGIGANGAIFSIVKSTILRPLPYAEPENLMILWERKLMGESGDVTVSYPNFMDWRNNNQSFEGLGAFYQINMTVGGGAEPRRAWASVTSPSLFPLIRSQPILGRYFLPEDSQPTTEPAVILGYDIWMQLFNGDRDVMNRSLSLDGRKHTIIGVMPQGFEFPIRFRHGDYQVPKVELWTPLKEVNSENAPRSGHYLFVLGRLKSGATLNNARADMSAIAKNLEKEYPNTNRGWGIRLIPLQQQYARDIRLMLLTLLGAVSALILIACANIANLRLSQSLSRQNEFAIRSAMGCSRWRLIRLLLLESLLLSLAGGAAGMAVAHSLLKMLIVIGTTDPRLLNSRLDGWIIIYIFLVSIFTAILFGLLPAIRASKANLMDLLKVDGQTTSSEGSKSHLSKFLVVAEVILSFVLLIGAGLMVRSFINLQNVNAGFDRNDILTAQIHLPSSTYGGLERPVQFFKEFLDRADALPGVESASMASDTPLDNENFALGFSIENRQKQPGDVMSASVRMIAPKYFRTMGIRVIEGREFSESDVLNAPGVVVINEAVARRFWPEENPIGKVISIGFPTEQKLFGKPIRRQIVGVVADTRDDRLETAAAPSLFVPHAQRPWTRMTVVVRSRLPVGNLTTSLNNEVRKLDGGLTIYNVKTMEQWVSEATSRHRFAVFLLNSFAILALTIAAVGIYSIVSSSVLSRSKEFGIRLALGATSENIIRSVLRQVGGLVLVGMIIGLGAAVLLSRLLSGILFEVGQLNLSIYLVISAIMILVALLAIYLPARKITAIDPYLTLHL